MDRLGKLGPHGAPVGLAQKRGCACSTSPPLGASWPLAFGPNTAWLVSACDAEERLQVWDVVTGRRRSDIHGTVEIFAGGCGQPG